MKHCPYCGKEYPDEVNLCPTDGKPLDRPEERQTFGPSPPAVQREHTTSPEEQQFWERMTFRQFAMLFIRLQAVWLLFYAVIDLTYLPSYWMKLHGVATYSEIYPHYKRELVLMLLRILLHVAAAVAVVQYAERVVSWFVRDWIKEQPPRGRG